MLKPILIVLCSMGTKTVSLCPSSVINVGNAGQYFDLFKNAPHDSNCVEQEFVVGRRKDVTFHDRTIDSKPIARLVA